MQRILGLRGMIYYSGILGDDDLEARQTELETLVRRLHQDTRQQQRNESSPSVERKTRSITRNGSVTRTMRLFARKRKKTMVCVRVPKLSRRRMREYKLIKDDMVGGEHSNGCNSNPKRTDKATQERVQVENTDWVDDEVEPTPLDNMETEKQDSTFADGIDGNPSDNPDGDEQASFFDEGKHRQEQFGEVRKMLDAMVRRSLQRKFLRPVLTPETGSEVGTADIKPFGAVIPSDHDGDNINRELDVPEWLDDNVWGLEAELIGEDEGREIPAKAEGNEDNVQVNTRESLRQDGPRQKAKQAKMKRKAERAEKELRQKEEKEGMTEHQEKRNKRKPSGIYTGAKERGKKRKG